MALHSDTHSPSIERLGPLDVPDVVSFLEDDPVLNVYLLALVLRDALARPRDEYWAVRRNGRITALLYLGGISGAVLPVGDDLDGMRELGDVAANALEVLPRRFQVIGPRAAVHVLLERFPRNAPPPRLARRQLYLSLSPGALPPLVRLPELRPAQREDYGPLYESGAELRIEELLEDPRALDPVGYARRVEEECRDGHTWVWRDAGGLCFRASVSAMTTDAAQVSGVYVPPARRRSGIARRALGEMCARLLGRTRHVCLFVNDFNAPALSLYRALGFVDRAPWASAFFDLER